MFEFGTTLVVRCSVVIAITGSSLALGVVGLCIFFVGFEYSIVTSFSLVSEAMPSARGRALAVGNGVSTVARGFGVGVSGILYETFEIRGPATLSVIGAAGALVFLALGGRRRPDLH